MCTNHVHHTVGRWKTFEIFWAGKSGKNEGDRPQKNVIAELESTYWGLRYKEMQAIGKDEESM